MERFLVPRAVLEESRTACSSGAGTPAPGASSSSNSGSSAGAGDDQLAAGLGLRAHPAPSRRQARIAELPKVVALRVPRLCVDQAEVLRLKAVLEASAGDSDAGERERQLMQALRQLACYAITPELLAESWVGPVVRRLRSYEGSEGVRRLAAALLGKWRSETLETAKRRNVRARIQ